MIRLLALIAFLAVPVAEIVVFIAVVHAIGFGWAILLALATSVLGVLLLRRQGLSALRTLRSDVQARRVPAGSIGEAIVVAIAGVLLVLPGFITDTIGLLLFLPPVRRGLWRTIAGSVKVHGPQGTQRPFEPRARGRSQVIDLEATEVRRDGDRR